MRFVTNVTIESGTEVRDASGGVTHTKANVQRLVGLHATILPFTDENRQERYTESEAHWLIIVDGHHPEITTSMWVTHGTDRYEVVRVATTKARKVTTITARFPSI